MILGDLLSFLFEKKNRGYPMFSLCVKKGKFAKKINKSFGDIIIV